MDWHVITSSKGGVGKTLISLMLSAYSRTLGEVLIIDFNGVNADLRRLLVEKSSKKRKPSFSLYFEHIGDFYLEKVRPGGYIVGWPNDAFKTLTAENFRSFLAQLSEEKKNKIEEELGTISTVIIDTNYHFCNLFSEEPKDYLVEPFRTFFRRKNENMFIWFIWVYRQITNLVNTIGGFCGNPDDRPGGHFDYDDRDVRAMLDRAFAIETNIVNEELNHSPFVHVFSPLSIGIDQSRKGINRLFDKENIVIDPLKNLANLPYGMEVNFKEFACGLKKVLSHLPLIENENIHELFLRLLEGYKNSVHETGRPRNIIPLYLFQRSLVGYTEDEYRDLLDQMPDLPLYERCFEPACRDLLGKK